MLKRVAFLLFGLAAFALLLLTNPSYGEAQAGECSPAKPAVEAGSTHLMLTSGGIEREYLVFVPASYNPTEPTPLVLSMHGYTSNVTQQQLYSGWNTVAQRENFIVVYPQGTGSPSRWYAYQRGGTFVGAAAADDVQFMRDLLDQLQQDYCIDPARIYANGISNGGGMTHRVACELADRIAAAGTVAGAFVQDRNCEPARPMPIVEFHGTDDEIVPYDGAAYLLGVEQWAAAWAERNGCDPTPETLPTQGDVSGIAYTGCAEDAEVILYTVDGGGHTWPGASPLLGAALGYTTQDIDATETMWDFFVAHPLN